MNVSVREPRAQRAPAALSEEIGAAMRQKLWAWGRVIGGVAILALVAWRIGTGPFLDGLRTINAWSLLAAASLAVLTTTACSWRWSLVSRGLGVGVPLGAAVAAYYRSQFLNVTLPGGVLGDVHRGLRHGRDVGDVGRGLRAVVWERTAGQVVQAVATITVLLLMPSPVRGYMPVVSAVVVGGALVVVPALRGLPQGGPSRWARTLRAARADVRHGLLARRAWPGVLLASIAVVAGHTLTFVVAARTAGVTAPTWRLVPLALLVLAAMAIPANIAGWGPREGVAAWAFAAAGLGGAAGVETSVVYGVVVLVASLPGAVVLLLGARRGQHRAIAAAGAGEPAPEHLAPAEMQEAARA